MKKIVLMWMVALMGTAMMNAQGHRHHGGMHSPEKMIESRVDRLDKALSLTADQKKAVTDLFKQEFEAQKSKRNLSKGGTKERPDKEQAEARRQEFKAQRDATDAQIEKLLTADQKIKFAQLKQEEARHMKDGRGPRHHHGKGEQAGKKATEAGDCCKGDAQKAGDCCKAEKKAQ